MFDIGWSELVVIAVVALIAIGPKELPGVLRSVGFWMGKVRKMAAEFQGQFQEAMREAEMSDLKKHADDLNNMAKGLTTDLSSTLNSALDPFDTAKESEAAKTARAGPRRNAGLRSDNRRSRAPRRCRRLTSRRSRQCRKK